MEKKKVNNNNIILKLPINTIENKINEYGELNFEKKFYDYDPSLSEPKAFDENNLYYNLDNTDNTIINDIDILKIQDNDYQLKSNLYKNICINCKEFENNIPNSTTIHCFWCCHKFDNKPCFLPIELNNNVFKVVGCFCSPECASAYNFKTYSHTCWEYNALLNLLYKITYKNVHIKIKSAPPKEVLNIFGGKLNINEFRSSSNYIKNHNIIYPPILSVLSKHEENDNDKDKFDNFKIKRTIPLKSKNTLDKFVITN